MKLELSFSETCTIYESRIHHLLAEIMRLREGLTILRNNAEPVVYHSIKPIIEPHIHTLENAIITMRDYINIPEMPMDDDSDE